MRLTKTEVRALVFAGVFSGALLVSYLRNYGKPIDAQLKLRIIMAHFEEVEDLFPADTMERVRQIQKSIIDREFKTIVKKF